MNRGDGRQATLTRAIRDELALKGFRVSSFSVPESGCFSDDLARMATNADAAVCVMDHAHIFLRRGDVLAHSDTVTTSVDDNAEVTAIRAAEIVRVRLEVAQEAEPAPPAPPPAPSPDARDEVKKTVSPAIEGATNKWQFGVTGGLLTNAADPHVAYPLVALSLSYGVQPWMDLRASTGAFYSVLDSKLRGEIIGAGPRFRLAQWQSKSLGGFDLKVGGGVAIAWGTNYQVTISDGPNAPGTGVSSDPMMFAYADADAAFGWNATSRLAFALDTSIGFAAQPLNTSVPYPLQVGARGAFAF